MFNIFNQFEKGIGELLPRVPEGERSLLSMISARRLDLLSRAKPNVFTAALKNGVSQEDLQKIDREAGTYREVKQDAVIQIPGHENPVTIEMAGDDGGSVQDHYIDRLAAEMESEQNSLDADRVRESLKRIYGGRE